MGERRQNRQCGAGSAQMGHLPWDRLKCLSAVIPKPHNLGFCFIHRCIPQFKKPCTVLHRVHRLLSHFRDPIPIARRYGVSQSRLYLLLGYFTCTSVSVQNSLYPVFKVQHRLLGCRLSVYFYYTTINVKPSLKRSDEAEFTSASQTDQERTGFGTQFFDDGL